MYEVRPKQAPTKQEPNAFSRLYIDMKTEEHKSSVIPLWQTTNMVAPATANDWNQHHDFDRLGECIETSIAFLNCKVSTSEILYS